MPLGKADKKYLNFSRGINTEASMTAWPDGFTMDECNFDLLPDGSRRRRPVIGNERGAVTADTLTHSSLFGDAFGVDFWNNVNNDPDLDFVVIQNGYRLLFYTLPDAGVALGDGYTGEFIDLRNFKVVITDPAYTASDTDIRQWRVDITFGQGRMFVVGKHIEPFFVEYNAETATFDTEQIEFSERDFNGIEDGITTTVNPEELTDEHEYNLRNRGWTVLNYQDYFNSTGTYPSKAQLMFRGMRRLVDGAYAEEDGIKEFSPDKLVAEVFQDSSAPQGHLRLNPFDTRLAFDPGGAAGGGGGGGTTVFTMESGGADDSDEIGSSGLYNFTIVKTGHGLFVNDTINIVTMGVQWLILPLSGDHRMYSGPYTVTAVPNANQFVIQITGPSDAIGFIDQTSTYTVTAEGEEPGGGIFITRSEDDRDALRYRFTTTQFFAGRVWYAGALDSRLGNKVYFSQISEDPKKAGKCYQQADPTSEFISELVATDGGVIVIPEMNDVQELLPFGHYLLVFATNGVWQIGPGELGIFSPTSYSVRKVSGDGCISRFSVVNAENIPMYWSSDGIYAISQDPNSGFLVSQNLTRDVINTLYTNIPFSGRKTALSVYDKYRKRVMFFYNPRQAVPTAEADDDGMDFIPGSPITPIADSADEVNRIGYTHVLILDLRLQAWTRWALDTGTTDSGGNIGAHEVVTAFQVPNDFLMNHDTRIKILHRGTAAQTTTTFREFRTWDDDNQDFADFGVAAQKPDAFIATGPDSLGEPAKFRYAPIVNVFLRRLEPETSTDASLRMQARWDWARGTISGKMSNFYQVYRQTRPNPNAYAMVVTRNKIPGRGRNLFLYFKLEDDEQAWLDGYTVNYDVQMKE